MCPWVKNVKYLYIYVEIWDLQHILPFKLPTYLPPINLVFDQTILNFD